MSVEVDWPPFAGDKQPYLPQWSVVPANLPGVDLSGVRDVLPDDVRSVVVASSFAMLVELALPMVTVKHMDGSTGKRVLSDCTYIMPEPWVLECVLRLGVLDDAMAGVSISTIRLNLNSGALHKWWQFVEGASLHVEAPKQPVQLRSRMEAFVQDNINEPTLRIQLTSGRTDGVLEQTKALDGTEVARAAAEREAAAESLAAAEDSNETHAAAHEAGEDPEFNLKVALQQQRMKCKMFVKAGESCRKLAEIVFYWGNFFDANKRYDSGSNYHRQASILYGRAAGTSTEQQSALSALQQARMCSESLFVEKMVQGYEVSFQKGIYRSYPTAGDEVLNEFCVMLDLSSDVQEHRQAAFSMVLPTVVRSFETLGKILTDSRQTAVFSVYKALVKHFLDTDLVCEETTLRRLEAAVDEPFKRASMQIETGDDMEVLVSKVMQQKAEDTVASVGSPTTTSIESVEASDKLTGKAPSRSDMVELMKLQTHTSWQKFVALVEVMVEQEASTELFVEAMLKSGLPVTRQQLFCLVNYRHDSPWTILINHRMANRKNLKAVQRYMGQVLMRNKRGVIEDEYRGYEAPQWLMEMLVAGRISKINWERLLAEVAKAKDSPYSPRQVEMFEDDNNRFTFPGFIEHIRTLGSKVLTAWNWNDPAQDKGSFEMLMDGHKEALEMARGVQLEPRQAWLKAENYGAYTRIWAALADAEESYELFMSMSPAQIMVGGSVSKLARSLIPFVPEVSRYYIMSEEADRKQKELSIRRRDMPAEYNMADTDTVTEDGIENPMKSGPATGKRGETHLLLEICLMPM